MNNKVLVISFSYEQETDTFKALEEAGLDAIVWKFDERVNADEDDLVQYYANLNEKPSGIIMGADIPITEKFLSSASELKVISLNCAGYDHIDLEACKKHGVVVMNVPRQNFDAVADLTWGLILASMRNIVKADKAIRQGKWNEGVERSMAVSGKTLGIIGLGAIGKGVAQRGKGFNMHTIAYDVYHDEAYAKENDITYVDLDTLLKEADIITLCCPYTEENHHMINKETLHMMKNSAVLINAARGGLMDIDAVYEALKDHIIASAGLDAYEIEPLYEHQIFTLDNVVVTPHVGGLADKQIHDVAMQATYNYIGYKDNPLYDKNIIVGGQ